VIPAPPDDEQRETELGISIVSEKMTLTYEQTIRLKDRTKISAALAWIQMRLSREGMTGQISTELQDGGCRRVSVTHVQNIPVGSPLQAAVEAVFQKKV
jgi:hypothetical protein